jgi:hypothetical protein
MSRRALLRGELGNTQGLCAQRAAQGLGKIPVSSVSVEGKCLDATPFTLTILAFQGSDPSVAGLIAYVKGRGRTVVSPCITRSEYGSIASGQGSYAFTEYSVTKEGIAVPIGETGSGDSTGAGSEWEWDWGTFWSCIRTQGRERSPDVAACLVGCAVSGPLYLKCAAACGIAGAVSITVDCTLAQLE